LRISCHPDEDALLRLLAGVSQKMLTQTLRSLERDGLVTRTATPTVPSRSPTRSPTSVSPCRARHPAGASTAALAHALTCLWARELGTTF
jgi:hypothetical protein